MSNFVPGNYDLRTALIFCYHLKKTAAESHRMLVETYGKHALGKSQCFEWFKKFKSGDFTYFLWGRKFILQTDHKPLVALLQTENMKGLKSTTAARLKRWAIRLLGYDFRIEYIRTTDFGHADALSRLMSKFRDDNAEELQVASIRTTENEIHLIRDSAIDTFGKDLRLQLATATDSDPDLKTVMNAIQNNVFPTECSPIVEHYKKRIDCISVVSNSLLLGDRVIIPKSMQPDILSSLHKGYPGIRRMKQLAREFVYWPKLSEDIEHLVQQCNVCALTKKLPIKVPISPWPMKKPLERMHLDFAGPIEGQYLLIFVDAYSKFIEVMTTPTISSSRTVELCREVFSRYSPPDILVSDHGTQFTADIFTQFCKEMQISHILTAVNHPQSNGRAERMVDSVKRAIAKNPSNWKKELQDFLYSYRYTPCTAAPEGKSLAEIFFGRRINSPFSKLIPSSWKPSPAAVEDLSIKNQNMQRQFEQHHGTRSRTLKPGDRVIVAFKDKRELGVIEHILSNSRFQVLLDNGRSVERHINHIWKRSGTQEIHNPSIADDWVFYEPDMTSDVTHDNTELQPCCRSTRGPRQPAGTHSERDAS
ncbi:Uncharacterized protein K02A2.6 [Trachymyrmex cornetzi]|uniref:RNA-directed DNA polymerase n=1 Tax=Trachymyrmex cornetzi TaxID=471704 RepID=A0A151J7T6_9HYME|nr:Uncharacterized protein K02A2.6 [Trachymyrmex cornetzi]